MDVITYPWHAEISYNPCYERDPSVSGQQPVRTNSCAEFMVWTNKTIKSMVLCYSSVRPRTKCGFRGGTPHHPTPLSPVFFFPIRRLSKYCIRGLLYIYIYIDKSTPTCQVRPDKWQRPKNKWCMSVMSPSTQNYMTSQGRHMSVMASQSAYLFVQQFVKANNKENIKVPRSATRHSRFATEEFQSHESRVASR